MEISDTLINEFVDIIYSKIEERFIKNINRTNVEFCSEGVVKSVNSTSNTAVVTLGFGDTDSLQNLSGETLAVGNKVKVFYNNKSMGGAYIGVKF